MESAADNVYLPDCFEILNCETTTNHENDQTYGKDSSIFCSDTITRYSKKEQSNRSEVIANICEENLLC